MILGLIENGLKLWLRKKCDSITGLEIKLKSSSIDLFKGNLHSVQIEANNAVYKNLPISSIRLVTNKIQIRLEKRKLQLKEKFIVKGNIHFTERNLEKILTSTEWGWIGELMSMKLLESPSLSKVEIINNKLFLESNKSKPNISKSENFKLIAESGKILITNKSNSKSIIIPMDKSINIKSANLNNGYLLIEGEAIVMP